MKNTKDLTFLSGMLYSRNGIESTAFVNKKGDFCLLVFSNQSRERVVRCVEEIIKISIPGLYRCKIHIEINSSKVTYQYKKWWQYWKKYDSKMHPISRYEVTPSS